MSSVIHVNVKLNDSDEDIFQIVKLVRPQWKISTVKFKRSPKKASRGFLNGMVVVFEDPDLHDDIMVRIQTTVLENFMNREREAKNMMLIHNLYGFAPNVLATFTNGFCYEYDHGDVMTPADLRVEEVWMKISKQLAQFHSTQFKEGEMEPSNFVQFFTQGIDNFPEQLKDPHDNERLHNELPKKDVLLAEIQIVRQRAESLGSPTVFCHCDTRPENMVWNKKSGAITFVDFESSGYAHQAQDIAYHFWRFAGVENHDYSSYPDRQFQLKWLKVYLETYNQQTKGSSDVANSEVERLFVQVNNFFLLFLVESVALISHLNTEAGLDDLGYDFLSVAITNYHEYCRRKDGIFALKMLI